MRKTLFSIAILLSSIFLFLLTYDFRAEQEQKFSGYTLSPEEYAMIQDGDIILRHGYGLVSDAIVETLKEEYAISHCAIVSVSDTNYKVIHTVSQSISECNGVQDQPLKPFVYQSHYNSIMVVRFKGPADAGKRISDKAQYYLDQKIPFDHNFDLTDPKEFYCSELIWIIILEEFGVDIFPEKDPEARQYLNFSNFYNSDFFEIIINHHSRKKIKK
jgi:uncharacterized protein YycO